MQFSGTGHIAPKRSLSSSITFSPLASTAAIGILAFLYSVALVSLFNLPPKTKDSALFVFGSVALPLLAVLLQRYIANRTSSDTTKHCIEAINIWIAASALFGLAVTLVYPWPAAGASEAWTRAPRLLVRS